MLRVCVLVLCLVAVVYGQSAQGMCDQCTSMVPIIEDMSAAGKSWRMIHRALNKYCAGDADCLDTAHDLVSDIKDEGYATDSVCSRFYACSDHHNIAANQCDVCNQMLADTTTWMAQNPNAIPNDYYEWLDYGECQNINRECEAAGHGDAVCYDQMDTCHQINDKYGIPIMKYVFDWYGNNYPYDVICGIVGAC
ncbi:hypothetical protein KIPB_004953 [Kipferlia bialata]|uniref:Saposin B-type domain-containing protein n=1 Tax=Kipferlia bialata TaxID=797122 RepID=A0A9K3CWH8_9EUKA|nr:hypothetical protein KIPB_004953 [Kipferlia bialata]|eukprot:g4953.t1